jgi:pimeloyl-ACP methyl ester carboxylesterase
MGADSGLMTSPTVENQLHDKDSRPDRQPPVTRTGRRRRRVIVAATIAVSVVALLLGNAATVQWQAADATGDSTLPVDGGKINVRQDGPRDAPALVLIHGLGGSTHWWDQVVPMLATSYRVIRIDLLGHGQSAKPSGDGYAIPQQAHRAGQALDQLGVAHATVVGHSTGGYVATSLAEQRADLVTAIALIDTGPRMDDFISDGPAGKLLLAPVLGQLVWRLRTDGIIRRGLSTAFAPGFTAPQQVVDDTRGMTYHGLIATSQASDDYLNQRQLPDRLAGLGKPLLVIFGEQDQRWHSSSASLYRDVAGARIELLAGVGHSPMIEDPSGTAALLLDFTRSVHSGR